MEEFENALTEGRAQWITIAPNAFEVSIGVTDEPENAVTRSFVCFAEDARTRSKWIDRDDGCMETLIGAHEEAIPEGFRYLFVTDQREIEIVSPRRPRIARK